MKSDKAHNIGIAFFAGAFLFQSAPVTGQEFGTTDSELVEYLDLGYRTAQHEGFVSVEASADLSLYDISFDTTDISADTTVSELLVERGISADIYSYSVVLELNPDLSSVDQVQAGQELTLPALIARTEDPSAFQTVSLIAAVRARETLSASTLALQTASNQWTQISLQNPDQTELAANLAEFSILAAERFHEINQPAADVPASVLRHYANMYLLVQDQIDAAMNDPSGISGDSIEELTELLPAANAGSSGSARARYVRYEVNLIDATGGAKSGPYQVYYRPASEFLPNAQGFAFGQPPTPFEQALPKANSMCFWVENVQTRWRSEQLCINKDLVAIVSHFPASIFVLE